MLSWRLAVNDTLTLLQACYYCSSNEVIPSYLSTSQDIWSFGCTLMKFFVGSSGPSTQKEVWSLSVVGVSSATDSTFILYLSSVVIC